MGLNFFLFLIINSEVKVCPYVVVVVVFFLSFFLSFCFVLFCLFASLLVFSFFVCLLTTFLNKGATGSVKGEICRVRLGVFPRAQLTDFMIGLDLSSLDHFLVVELSLFIANSGTIWSVFIDHFARFVSCLAQILLSFLRQKTKQRKPVTRCFEPSHNHKA